MYKKAIALVVILLIAVQSAAFAYGGTGGGNEKSALIVYDSRFYYGYSDDMVESLEGLLAHFRINTKNTPQEEYEPGMCSGYDYVFVLGTGGGVAAESVMADLRNTNSTVVWLGKGVGGFLRGSGMGIGYSGVSTDFVQVTYERGKGAKGFAIGPGREFAVLEPSNESAVYAYLDDGGSKVPFAVNEGNFWHIARFENQGILFYIVADILHDILGETDFEESQVYIRIEDVHPKRSVKNLKAVADYLYKRDIPFMIALIPVYKDPGSGDVTTMDDMPEFAGAIRYMQDKGGSVVLHGYTHQGFERETSGEGFEFWNGIEDAPLDADMEAYVFDKVNAGLSSCIRNGIYPLGFESPHYAMDIRGYREIKKYFSTYVGQVQENDIRFGTTEYPYRIYDTERVNKLLPENLGYVDPENPFALDEIFENYDKVDVVRGSMKGVFFHSYLDASYLRGIVEGLERRGAVFYDMKKEDHWVSCAGISISTSSAGIVLDIEKSQEAGYEECFIEDGQDWARCIGTNVIKKDGTHIKYREPGAANGPEDSISNRISAVNDILIAVISVFCMIFIVIFTISKRKSSKNLFK